MNTHHFTIGMQSRATNRVYQYTSEHQGQEGDYIEARRTNSDRILEWEECRKMNVCRQ
jgi:hypothetical protein